MVGELPAVEPVLPVVRGPREPLVGVLVVARRVVLAPGQRAEDLLALLHHVACGRARALEAEVEVGDQPQVEVAVGDAGLVVALLPVAPAAALAPVVEGRLAVERHLHLAVDAANGAQQHVVGVVVGRRAAVRVRAVVVVVPRTDQQDVAHDQPAAGRVPTRLEHHRAGQVAASGRDANVRRADAEQAGVAVEDRPEDARRVHARQTHPLDVAAGGDQGRRLAVGQEAIVGNRGEGTALAVLGGGELSDSRRVRTGALGANVCHGRSDDPVVGYPP